MIKKCVLAFFILVSSIVYAQSGISDNDKNSWTQEVNGSTVDIFTRNNKGPTILYIPGCNGLDKFGQKYQHYHEQKFKEYWPEANFVISQYVNDYTKNSTDGRCDWKGSDPRLVNRQSKDQAQYILGLADWIKKQPWSTDEVHLFGYSWGGRVGLWLPGDVVGKDQVFKTVALIWPDCRNDQKMSVGSVHTPVKIWATENDPLSNPTNCPTFYNSHRGMISLSLFPGSTHSWFDPPIFQSYTRWWPVQNTYVRHEYNVEWTNQTFREWKEWTKQYR
jgi:dienelactone hydrolase